MKLLKITPLIILFACSENVVEQSSTIDTIRPQVVDTTPIITPQKQPQPTKIIYNQQSFDQLSSLYKKEHQVLKINPAKDTTIIGKKGTQIYIPAHAIISDQQQVTLYLKEAYSLADCIKNNLTTTSNGKQLITNGMIKLTPSSKVVSIDKNNPIQIKFPSANNEANDLFLSERDANGIINWIPQNQPQTPTNNFTSTLFSPNETRTAVPYKGLDTLIKYIKYPPGLHRTNKKGTVVLNAQVNELGVLDTIQLMSGIHPEIDKMIIRGVRQVKFWRPSFLNGEAITSSVRLAFKVYNSKLNYRIDLPPTFKSAKRYETLAVRWVNAKRDEMEAYDPTNVVWGYKIDRKVQETPGYIFSLKSWGWINCDYFKNTPSEYLAKMKIDLPTDLDVRLIMHGNQKSLLTIRDRNNKRAISDKIDKRKPYTVLAIKKNGDKWVLGTKFLPRFPQEKVTLKYQELELSELNKKLNELDNN